MLDAFVVHFQTTLPAPVADSLGVALFLKLGNIQRTSQAMALPDTMLMLSRFSSVMYIGFTDMLCLMKLPSK